MGKFSAGTVCNNKTKQPTTTKRHGGWGGGGVKQKQQPKIFTNLSMLTLLLHAYSGPIFSFLVSSLCQYLLFYGPSHLESFQNMVFVWTSRWLVDSISSLCSFFVFFWCVCVCLCVCLSVCVSVFQGLVVNISGSPPFECQLDFFLMTETCGYLGQVL